MYYTWLSYAFNASVCMVFTSTASSPAWDEAYWPGSYNIRWKLFPKSCCTAWAASSKDAWFPDELQASGQRFPRNLPGIPQKRILPREALNPRNPIGLPQKSTGLPQSLSKVGPRECRQRMAMPGRTLQFPRNPIGLPQKSHLGWAMPFPRNQTKSASVVSRGIPLDWDFLRNQARPKIFECGDFPRNLPRNPKVSRGIQIRKKPPAPICLTQLRHSREDFLRQEPIGQSTDVSFLCKQDPPKQEQGNLIIYASVHLPAYRPTFLSINYACIYVDIPK